MNKVTRREFSRAVASHLDRILGGEVIEIEGKIIGIVRQEKLNVRQELSDNPVNDIEKFKNVFPVAEEVVSDKLSDNRDERKEKFNELKGVFGIDIKTGELPKGVKSYECVTCHGKGIEEEMMLVEERNFTGDNADEDCAIVCKRCVGKYHYPSVQFVDYEGMEPENTVQVYYGGGRTGGGEYRVNDGSNAQPKPVKKKKKKIF